MRKLFRALAPYLFAVAAVGAAAALTQVAFAIFGRRPMPALGLIYMLAMLAPAWWGGYGPGVLACLTCALAARLQGLPFSVAQVVSTGLISLLVSRIADLRNRTELMLRALNEQLEEKVRLRTTELQQSRDWLETTLASIGDAVIATDVAGKVTFLNPIAQALTGWKQADAAGQTLDQVFVIINEDLGSSLESPVTKVFETGGMVGLDSHTLLISRDGHRIPIADSAAPIRDSSGTVLGVVLVFRDITTQRENERTAAEAQVALREYADLVNLGHVVSRDGEGRIVSWSKGAAELYGWPEEEALGQLSHTLLKTRFPKPLSEIEAEVLNSGSWSGELTHTAKDGRELPVASHWSLLRGTDGAIRILEINNDITGLKHIQAALEQTNEELNRFTYAASHDLKEPLRTINSFAWMILRRAGAMDQEHREFLELIVGASKRMSDLIEGLLEYSLMLNAPRLDGPTPLVAAIEWALQNLGDAIRDSGATIRYADLPTVDGDVSQLGRVFQNLIGNAIKYRSPDRDLEITISVETTGDQCTISVEDNGPGFRPEYAEKIFEPFKRLHGQEHPGSGLGLAISRRIIERHSGRIWAEGGEGGACFYFTLPCCAPRFSTNAGS